MGNGMSEQTWTKDKLVPKLRQLGFNRIDITHGVMEAGRDIVFADMDRFGLLRFYAAQVKVGSIRVRSETRELGSIIQQLSFAYKTPYIDPASGSKHHIRGVYLIVDGEVSDPARQILADRLGQWLHIVDKRQLVVAGAFTAHISNNERLSRISNLLLEMDIEAMKIPAVINSAKTVVDGGEGISMGMSGLQIRTRALERYLDIAHDELSPNDTVILHQFRDAADSVNFISLKIPLGRINPEEFQPTFQTLVDVASFYKKMLGQARSLLKYVLSQERPQLGKRVAPWPDNPRAKTVKGNNKTP